MQNNDKIQNFFSEQLREVKERYNRVWGKVYVCPNDTEAITRCLELADWDLVLSDIQVEQIRCKCGKDKKGFVIVNPNTFNFFCVAVCNCK